MNIELLTTSPCGKKMPATKKKLVIGRRAPDFTLPATGGKSVRLSDFRGKRQVALAFYCLDWTPG